MNNAAGHKNDSGKARFDLIPPNSLYEIAIAFTIGAKKYGERNWEQGMRWGRVFAAMMRHAWAWWTGEKYDKEDGQHHLAALAWGAMVLMEYERNKKGEDDRTLRETCELESQSSGRDFHLDEMPTLPGIGNFLDEGTACIKRRNQEKIDKTRNHKEKREINPINTSSSKWEDRYFIKTVTREYTLYLRVGDEHFKVSDFDEMEATYYDILQEVAYDCKDEWDEIAVHIKDNVDLYDCREITKEEFIRVPKKGKR